MRLIRLTVLLFAFVSIATAAVDCIAPFGSGGGSSIGAVGQTVQYNNIGKQCYDWRLSYTSQGFSAISLIVESAPNSSGSPGTFVTFTVPDATNPITGVNPNTNTTAASTYFRGAPAFVRVRLASATGTGSITGWLYGCNEPGCGSGMPLTATAGSTCPNPCPVTGGPVSVDGPDAAGAPPVQNPVAIALFDGVNLQRPTGSSASTLANANNNNRALFEKGARWSVVSSPGASLQASATKAAGGAGVRHVADCITFSALTGTAPAATATVVNLRDGASGAGTVLMVWATEFPATANNQEILPHTVCGLNLIGTANTAMTLEFAVLVTNASQVVTLTGYDVN